MRRLLPSPVSVLSAVLSFLLLVAHGAAAAVVVPPLLDLLRRAPHLAMLGLLAFVVAPGVLVSAVHRASNGALDRAEARPSAKRARWVESWAAGAHAWLVLYGATLLSRLVLLVLDPPELDPDLLTLRHVAAAYAATPIESAFPLVWIAIATALYELHARGRREG